jgi:hypothetical protein
MLPGYLDERAKNMAPQVQAAWIAAAIALPSALITAYLTVWNANRQRAADFIVAALTHMGGGTQERSSGVAALMAIRGPIERKPRFLERTLWRRHGPAVGQQLYRQATYVLNHGNRKYYAHEVENLIIMLTWLLTDQALAFRDPDQRARLAQSMQSYTRHRDPAKNNASLDALVFKIPSWSRQLMQRTQG